MSDMERDGAQPAADGGFDPWKVYETLAAILNRREGVEVRLTGLFQSTPPEPGSDKT